MLRLGRKQGRRRRALLAAGLLAVLAQFAGPLFHTLHDAGLPSVEQLTVSLHSATCPHTDRHAHDDATCPLCRTASHLRSVLAPGRGLADAALPILCYRQPTASLVAATGLRPATPPRAPPAFS